MPYQGQDRITNGIDSQTEFTEKLRQRAYTAVRAAEADCPVNFQTIEELDRLATQEVKPSHQANELLRRILANEIQLDLPTDRSGLAVGFDNAVGLVWQIQGRIDT